MKKKIPMITDRQQWLEERKKGIGGSDAAAILGLSQYMDMATLWEIKTGRREQEDISDKPNVYKGIQAEPLMIAMFALDYPQYQIESQPFDIIWSDKTPFLYATLDARLIELETGKKGVYEGKRAEARNSTVFESWGKWDSKSKEFTKQIPYIYYVQCLHQLYVTGWDFVILRARIYTQWNDTFVERNYRMDKTDENVVNDTPNIIGKEIEFWNKYVVADVRPPLDLGL